MRFAHPDAVLHWPAPNYVDPERRGPALYIVNSIAFGLATVAVIVRLYARIFVRRWVGPDDALIFFAWISGMGDLATIFYGFHNFWWDRHLWDTKPEFLTPGAKTALAAKIFWTTTSTFIRLSLLCTYYRLLNHVQMPQYRWVLHLTLAFIVAIYLSFLGTTIWSCVPTWAYFVWPSPGSCINEDVADTTLSAINTFSEALVAALPIPVIMQLKMDNKTRWTVVSLLCLGFLVAVVGVFRTYYVSVLFGSDDLTWWVAPHWICSEVEICVAMCCASAPALKPVISRLLSKRRNSSVVPVRPWPRFARGRKLSSTTASINSDGSYSVTRKLNKETPYTPFDGTQYWRTVDVEGIGVDGLGYSVTITTSASRRRSRLRKPEPTRSRSTQGSVTRPEKSWSLRSNGTPRGSSQLSRDGGGSRSNSLQGIEIMARKSLEVVVEAYGEAGESPPKGKSWSTTSVPWSGDCDADWRIRQAI